MAHGSFKFDNNGYGKGQFRSLAMALDLQFEPSGNERGDKDRPTHNVYAKGAAGLALVGAAWEKVGERGEMVGKVFYSFTVDDPSLQVPLYLFLFPAKGGEKGEYEIHWRRERGAAQQAA